MPTKKSAPAGPSSGAATGFTAEERAAVKARAEELRAEGRKGAKAADGLEAALESMAKMDPQDRALAENVHRVVTTTAPGLSAKTWYGMPAYMDADGRTVVAFKNSGKFKQRYSTLEFQEAAALDDGDIWPVSWAITTWSPAVEQKLVELVRAAVG